MNILKLIGSVAILVPLVACTQHDDEKHIGDHHVHVVNVCQERMDSLMLTKGAPDRVTVTDRGSTWSTYWYYSNVRYEMRSQFNGSCRTFGFVDLSQ